MMVFLNFIFVFSFGGIFGFSELLNRHSEIKYTFTVWQSYMYIALNGIVSIIAFLLIGHFKSIDFLKSDKIEIESIIIAGLGGMMILRSSLFSIEQKGKKIEIGFGLIAQIFLDAVEKKIATRSAVLRLEAIDQVMKNIDFYKAKEELTTLCISHIDNFSDEDAKALTGKIAEISNLDITNRNKSLQLGRYISLYCNYEVLSKAIELLSDGIKKEKEDENLDSIIGKLNRLNNER